VREFFEPSSVAVVGASREPGKLGHEILRNIIDAGYKGNLYPVNPKADEILGLKCYPSVKEIPASVDLVVIAVPAKITPRVIAECGEKGITAAIVISGGFREAGDAGAELERQLLRFAKKAGVRIVGPNCQGINSTSVGLCASWPLVKLRGPISVISQSGTILAALSCWAESDGIGVSKLVALGNKCDVNETELLEYLANDASTKVIGLYLEGVENGRKFREVARRVVDQKPVIVLKGGRTARGTQAARSHTRSLAGLDQVFDAVFRDAGIIRARTVEEFYDLCKAFAFFPLPRGPNVVIVTSSGGSGILATDACEELGLGVIELPEGRLESLRQSLPSECILGNPLDLTGSATSQMYDDALSAILGSDSVHSALVIVGDPMPGISEVISKHLATGKPIVPVMLGGGKVEEEERSRLASEGIPTYPTPSRGAGVLAALYRYAERKA
jgi:acetyl coenzyme A synthetase (ADP forming)-like protein